MGDSLLFLHRPSDTSKQRRELEVTVIHQISLDLPRPYSRRVGSSVGRVGVHSTEFRGLVEERRISIESKSFNDM